MQRGCCLLLLWLYAAALSAQPFATGRRTLSFTDAARGNRIISTELYYPAAVNGSNVPFPPGTQSFALVVFGHGFLIPAGSYSWLGDSLARQGFIVAFPGTEGSLSPDHAAFGADIAFLCRHLPTYTDSSGSWLQGRISYRVAAGGHSMGGGASFLAAAGNPMLQALFNFAAAETSPSAKDAAGELQAPALVLAGGRDCIVPDSNQLRMYQQIPYPCKTYVNITDALHCHFANNNSTCASGQFFSGCNSSPLTTASVFSTCTRLLIPFLRYYLNDSCSNLGLMETQLNSLSGISFLRSCSSNPFTCPFTEFQFTGNGAWSHPLNWSFHRVPPMVLPTGYSIRIAPAPGGSCRLDRPQGLNPGSSLLLEAGKTLLIPENLTIR